MVGIKNNDDSYQIKYFIILNDSNYLVLSL
jgi:hypothetical protein